MGGNKHKKLYHHGFDYQDFSHIQRPHLQEKYDELALNHELLKMGKELSYQQVVGLKDKIALLEKDLVASGQVCEKQKKSLKFAREQRKRLLQVKVDLIVKEKENKKLVEKLSSLPPMVILFIFP
ncbi:hypothetical protein SLEP1_g17505 [Rubroshorea leprosula]|uniref:Uncharacterized protein n=1 Tax=Rubroshorea leprosula TaxID=152421 RepID=A0AAV5J3K0_9ROSI|nr:hypothetical protein SLEP1_g17505 [Rubroshorea leprosula]